MNIMVFDVPAESGGALSVLNDFYNEVEKSEDKSINWTFVLSTPKLKSTANIKVLQFPWVKKSWVHRFYFDQVIAPKLVKQYQVDKVFSLQNVTIPRVSCEQFLYMHQPLPFVDYKFSFKENKLFWVYQNIIGRSIINSIKKAKRVIVQTEWMKKACIEKTRIESNKIEVIAPIINVKTEKYFEPNEKALSTFFYPASGLEYKNHQVILDACRELKASTKANYEIIFTLNGNENKHVAKLYRQVQEEKLPIRFEGSKTREEVFDLYTKSILLFPSYIETFGLPMLEAKMHNGIICASDFPFSHEILDGYKNVYFFNPFDLESLFAIMDDFLQGKKTYIQFLELSSDEKIKAVHKTNKDLINIIKDN
jgi:glycosyltransferase involved in cell wall biosynthesis